MSSSTKSGGQEKICIEKVEKHICVGGIYASLNLRGPLYDSEDPTEVMVRALHAV